MQQTYEVIRSKRKTLCITITKEARVVVRAPRKTPEMQIQQFVEKNQHWIETHLETAQQRLQTKSRFHYADGEQLPFLGNMLTLQTADVVMPQVQGHLLLLPLGNRKEIIDRFLKKELITYLEHRVAFFAAQMSVQPFGLRVTSAKARWGSCSGKNSLCFSYRLACLSPALIDAVIVHELAHIRQKNHSAKFYAEVYAVLPDYPQRNTQLREASRMLPL